MAVKSLARSGITNFEKYSSMLAGNAAYSPNAFDLLETVTLSSNQASVTFSNLSSYATYQHLQIRLTLRSNLAQTYEEIKLTFNGDGGNNYTDHYLACNGSSVFSGYDTTGNYGFTQPFSMAVGNSNASGIFGAGVIDLLDAFDTTKYKSFRSLGGRVTADGEKRITLASGLWLSTAAISSIAIAPKVGSAWLTGSRISIYGVKGS